MASLSNPGTCRSNPLACGLTTVTERRGDAFHRDRDAGVEGYLLRDLARVAAADVIRTVHR
jgi:hypothetical protein